jgi:hypothetical protein
MIYRQQPSFPQQLPFVHPTSTLCPGDLLRLTIFSSISPPTKLSHASRTLPKTVREHHRRYARADFDRWSSFHRTLIQQVHRPPRPLGPLIPLPNKVLDALVFFCGDLVGRGMILSRM